MKKHTTQEIIDMIVYKTIQGIALDMKAGTVTLLLPDAIVEFSGESLQMYYEIKPPTVN